MTEEQKETNWTPIIVIAVIIVIGLWAWWSVAHNGYVTVKYRTNGQVNISASNFEPLNRSDSTVGGAWYDSAQQYMVIKLGSTYYHYCGMPEGTWSGLKGANSPYSYYQNSIKGDYDCRVYPVPSY